jgi:hypothetical protein
MSVQDTIGESAAQEMILAARAHYQRVRRALGEVLARIEAGELKAVEEFDRTHREFSKTLTLALEQEIRLDERSKAHGAAGRGGPIDLDAARSEIGRRLACLRAAGGGGGVPGGAE